MPLDQIKQYPDLVASAIYLILVICIALSAVFVGPDRYFNKLKNYHWDTIASDNVWRFTPVVLVANGYFHSIKLMDWDRTLTLFPKSIIVIRIAHWSVNILLMVWVIGRYNRDVERRELEYSDIRTRTRALLAYFAPVGGLIIFEHELSMYWDDFGAKGLIGDFVTHGAVSGRAIVMSVFALVASVYVAIRYRDRLIQYLSIFAVRTVKYLVPVTVLLIICIIAAAYFVGGGIAVQSEAGGSSALVGPRLSATQ